MSDINENDSESAASFYEERKPLDKKLKKILKEEDKIEDWNKEKQK